MANKIKEASNFTPTKGGPTSLLKVLSKIKNDFDMAAKSNEPERAMLSVSRSAIPIKRLHQHVGDLLIQTKISSDCIDIERSIPTLLGDKRQDLVAIPRGKTKPAGRSTLNIGMKGAFYGVQKNRDNHFNGVRGELLSFHELHSNMVVGQVTILSLMEWDPKKSTSNTVAYKKLSQRTLAEFIDRYNKINLRKPDGSIGLSERVALILVDFSKTTPVVYESIQKLESDGFLMENSGLSLHNVTLSNFASDIVSIHRSRFTGADRL